MSAVWRLLATRGCSSIVECLLIVISRSQLFLVVGFILPLCAMPASFAFSEHGVVTAAVMGPYVGTLAIQIAQEVLLLRQSESCSCTL